MNFKNCTLFVLLSAVMLSSCGNVEVERSLSDVGSFIQDRPDSALVILRSIDKSSLHGKRLRARYSLLSAMAYDKNYIDTADVSVIAPAIEYYSRHGSADDKLKALYYQGVIYYNGQEYEKAIVSFSKAEELVPKAKDKRFVGLLYSSISSTYGKTHNSTEELRYIKLAEGVFNEAGLSQYYYTTRHRIAQAYHNSRLYNDAERYYQDLLLDSGTPDWIKRSVKEDYALLLTAETNRYLAKALKLFEEVISEGKGLKGINEWAAYAYALASCGFTDKADNLFGQLYEMEQKDYSVVDIWKSLAYESEGNYKGAYALLQKSLIYQDSLLNLSISQATVRAQRDYLAFDKSQLEILNKNNRIKSLTLIFVLVLLILTLYIVFRNKSIKFQRERAAMAEIADSMKLRLKESEKDWTLERISLVDTVNSQRTQISSLNEKIDRSESALSRLRAEYARMYKSQFKYLGELSEAYLLAKERTDSHKIIYNKVQDIIKDISGDKAGQKRFEQMIDKTLGGIMKHFREDYPDYSEDDYRFVSYLFVGFDATAISIILNMPSVASVYTRKSRIKRVVQESESKNKGVFLEMLS